MVKYTQKQLKGMVTSGMAIDISHISFEDAQILREKEGYLNQIGYSSGVYGCNGQLHKGYNTGQLYAIIGGTQAIYLF